MMVDYKDLREMAEGMIQGDPTLEGPPVVIELLDEIERLKRSTRCAYCGEEFPLDTVTADQVGAHISKCDKHPMRKMEDEILRLDTLCCGQREENEKLKAEIERLRGIVEVIKKARKLHIERRAPLPYRNAIDQDFLEELRVLLDQEGEGCLVCF